MTVCTTVFVEANFHLRMHSMHSQWNDLDIATAWCIAPKKQNHWAWHDVSKYKENTPLHSVCHRALLQIHPIAITWKYINPTKYHRSPEWCRFNILGISVPFDILENSQKWSQRSWSSSGEARHPSWGKSALDRGVGLLAGFVLLTKSHFEPRKKPSYFPLCWLLNNRDPYNGFW